MRLLKSVPPKWPAQIWADYAGGRSKDLTHVHLHPSSQASPSPSPTPFCLPSPCSASFPPSPIPCTGWTWPALPGLLLLPPFSEVITNVLYGAFVTPVWHKRLSLAHWVLWIVLPCSIPNEHALQMSDCSISVLRSLWLLPPLSHSFPISSVCMCSVPTPLNAPFPINKAQPAGNFPQIDIYCLNKGTVSIL